MAVVTQVKLGASGTTYDINDKRISTTAVSTATHLLTTNSGVTSIAPITTANLASVLGGVTYEKTLDIIATSISITNSDNTGSVYFEVQAASGYRAQIIYGVIGGSNDREVYWTSLSERGLEGKNHYVHKSVNGNLTTAFINFGNSGNVNYKVKVRGLKSAVTVEGSNLEYYDLQSYDLGVNCGIPKFYNNYSDLSSLASALGGVTNLTLATFTLSNGQNKLSIYLPKGRYKISTTNTVSGQERAFLNAERDNYESTRKKDIGAFGDSITFSVGDGEEGWLHIFCNWAGTTFTLEATNIQSAASLLKVNTPSPFYMDYQNLSSLASALGDDVFSSHIKQITKNNTYTRSSTPGGLMVIGHWIYGFGLYQYGRLITGSWIAGTNVCNATIAYSNDTLTITAPSDKDVVVFALI